MTVPQFSSKTITGENVYSDWIALGVGGVLTLSGTFIANVKVERKDRNGGITQITNNDGTPVTMIAPGTYTINPFGIPAAYRFGVPTGGYTSGTVVGFLEGT